MFSAGLLPAQVNRYMVFFADKTGTTFSVDNPEEFLSPRAIERRVKQNISITAEDLPIVGAYIESVQASGAVVLYKTKWMNGVLIESDAALISAIELLPFVTQVEYVAPGPRPNGRVRMVKSKTSTYGKAEATDVQLSVTALDQMHSAGYRGEGMLIAVFDSGFSGADVSAPFQHIFQENRFDALTSYNFVHRSTDVFNHDDHGTRVWSVMAGYQPGSFTGGAYKADFVLFITEDDNTEYRVEEYNWLFAAEKADSAGVDIINTSLGYSTFDDGSMNYTTSQMDGETATVTRAAELAASKGIAVVASAGNEANDKDWRIITAPADGRNVLAIGGVTESGVKTTSSSIGPSADGRVKPDVMALGTGVATILPNGNTSTGSGTSFSAPIVTSLVAGVWQMLPDYSAKQILDTIRSTASQANNPDNQLGYGIANFLSILNITSVEESRSSRKLVEIYPNPASREVYVKPLNKITVDRITPTVLNMHGQSIPVPMTRSDELLMLDVSVCAAGFYMIQVLVNGQASTHKLLKID
jgi:serine protease AprX